MKPLPKLALIAAILPFVTQSAMANSLTNSDLRFAFGEESVITDTTLTDKQIGAQLERQPLPLQLSSIQHLSAQEMKDTEGAWLSFLIRGISWGWNRTIVPSYGFASRQIRNTRIDGPRFGVNGGRVFQIRRYSRPVFRLDYKPNPSPSKLHLHFGRNNMNYHRPWYNPWIKY